jgi:exonuclease SbcC
MKLEKERLLRLQGQLKDQEPLTPEVRAAKDIELQTQADSAKTLDHQKSVLESHLRWYQRWDQLKAAEAQAGQHLEAATTAKQAAAPRQKQLALVDRVQPARPLWAEQVRLHQAVAVATTAQDLAKAALATSQDEVTIHQAGHDAALQQQRLADTAKTDAQPAIDSARILDASIAAITPQFEAAAQAHQTAAEHLKTEQSRQTQAQKRMDAAKADLATAQQWLADNAQLRPLAEGWQRWDALFAQAQQMVESQSKVLAQVANLETSVVAAEQSVSTATVALNKTTRALDADSAQLKVLSQECAAVDVEKLVAQKLTLEQDRDQLQTASQLWQRRLETQKQQQLQVGQRQKYADTLVKSDTDLLEGLQAQPLLERELQTAEESLNLATLAASENAESMRAALQTDKECPVCGSLEHPYAVHTPAMDAVLTSLKDSVKTKRKALRELESSIATARAAKASAESSTSQITLALSQLESEIANLSAEWAAHALHAQIDLVPELDQNQWLTQRQDGVRREIEQLTQQEALYRETVKRKDAAQEKVNTANLSLAQAKEALSGLDTQHKTGVHALDTARNQQYVIVQQLLAIENQIDGAFDNQEWRGQWSQNPGAFVAQCNANALAWVERQTSVTTLSSNMAALQVGIGACEKACSQAAEQLKTQTDSRDAVELLLNTYRSDRSALFDGRPVAEVEAAFNAAIQVAKSALAASQIALHQAQVEVTRSMEAARQSETLLEQHRIALLDARSSLQAWLADFNIQSRDSGAQGDLGLDALESLLQIAPEWATGEREELQKLEHSVTTAKAVLDTRSHSRITHEADKADKSVDNDLDVLQDKLAQLLVAIGLATEAMSALKLEIAKDDERLGASAVLRVTIAKQAAVSKVWAQLSELIGSSDGKKFRNFAQQLTLDILLSYGNTHLQSLTRRYRLQRIKDSLGLLVVDQDMGDEVRSVHSLSGGESFLVSLALALGLASLSSHRVRVESLFIDEGFGSLDADSLGIAMDALDNLQSQGRKVGVISHVQEMTERIGTRVQVQRQAGGLSRIVVC